MKIPTYFRATAILFLLTSCVSEPDIKDTTIPPTDATAKTAANPLIKELDGAMKTAEIAGKIYLDSSDAGNYIYASPEAIMADSGKWSGYSPIQEINVETKYGNPISVKNFKKPDTGNGFNLKLLPPSDPQFSWTIANGANLSLEVKNAVGASIDGSTNFIYELIINKVAIFDFSREYLDEPAFNAYVVSQYVGNKTTVSLDDFNIFKKKYGVAVGGVIYEITVNKFRETEIKAGADIPALVKLNGKFYSKQGGSIRISTVKLNYALAEATQAQLNSSIVASNIVAQIDSVELVKGLTQKASPLSLNANQTKAIKTLTEKFKGSKVDLK